MEGNTLVTKPNPTPAVPCWMTLKDAARHIGTSMDTLRRRISDGQLPAYYVGRSHMVRLRLDDVDALMRPVVTVRKHR